jgi:outer membrane protein OmpA-like peptidoglycan-associated protein
MNKLILMALFTSLFFSSYASSKIKHPAYSKTATGFENVNNRKTYQYHQSPNEDIWHEFGRPFWKSKKSKVTIKKVTPLKIKPIHIARVKTDSDKDGVSDLIDQCPDTLAGQKVNSLGCGLQAKRNLSLDVKFALNKSLIIKDYTSAIDKLGLALQNDKNLRIEIQGHTDPTGSKVYNKELSLNRARSVKGYLVGQYNISEKRLTAIGFGDEKPLTSNLTRVGRETNRRVEIKIQQ